MRSCVWLERWTLEVVQLFADAAIEVRLLKGPAVAHLDYPDPAWRAFGDIDVLVPSAQYDDAIRALLAVGGRRRSQEVRPGFDRRFGKGACVTLLNGVQVDVHRTLASGPFGLTVDLGVEILSSQLQHIRSIGSTQHACKQQHDSCNSLHDLGFSLESGMVIDCEE